jgi:hypothetical protein
LVLPDANEESGLGDPARKMNRIGGSAMILVAWAKRIFEGFGLRTPSDVADGRLSLPGSMENSVTRLMRFGLSPTSG